MPFANFTDEAPTPRAATLHEAVTYYFRENERRARQSVDGLTAEDFDHDPGHGAWSIGELVKHQIDLIRMVTETMSPESTKDVGLANAGEAGHWNVRALAANRAELGERFLEVFDAITAEGLMETQPGAYPPRWKEWPILMRVLRPVLDIATHIGQVNYARRQLDSPVGTSLGAGR